MSVYLSKGVNAKAVEAYLRKCYDNGIHIRALQVIKGKEPMLRLLCPPYDYDEPMHLYSLSKSFTSIACGICIDEGLLSANTLLSELFPDKLPENPSEELLKMTLADALSMQSGHGVCALTQMRFAEDSIKSFFEQPLDHKPGTTFIYSTGATCVCAAAVEKVTGKKLVDFLYEKLFSKLDIKKPLWAECRDGQTLGGIGIYLSNNDVTKFGMMLKNKGVYNGERIVSEEYIAEATSKHALDVNNGSKDWTAGYGYQFWMNARGGYRADGAYGQLCMVFPETDTLVTIFGEVNNMPLEVECVYELIDTMYGEDTCSKSLEELTETLYKPNRNNDGFYKDLRFSVAENPAEVKEIRLFGDELLHLELNTDYGKKEIVCGNGEYILNHVMLKNLQPTIVQLDPMIGLVERVSVFASYEILSENKIALTLRHLDTCHVQHWDIDTESGKINITLRVGGMNCTSFDLSRSIDA